MNRRETMLGLLALGAAPRASFSQQPGRIFRVGWLGGAPPPDGKIPATIRASIQALGYTEGREVIYEARWFGGKSERLPGLAAELLALKVDLIITGGGPTVAAAKQATSSIPIISTYGGDLVEIGLVASLARPGGNVTGVNDQSAALSAKRLELLKEAVPTMRRVAVLWNADDKAMSLRYREIERAAEVLRVRIEPLGVREPDDFDAALAAMGRTRPDALMLVTDSLANLNRQRILDYAAAQRIPTMFEFANFVQSGGLMSYGSDPVETQKVAADYAVRIFKGAKPADLPVQQPNRYYLNINLKTAKALGIGIAQSLQMRADQVIQ